MRRRVDTGHALGGTWMPLASSWQIRIGCALYVAVLVLSWQEPMSPIECAQEQLLDPAVICEEVDE